MASQTTVRVGVYWNPPKSELHPAGNPSGIYVPLLEYAVVREGWQLRYVPGTFQQGLDRLGRGELDLMVDVAKTPERSARYDFAVEPVLYSWNEVYVRRDLGVRYMFQLEGRSVAVLRGSVHEALFRDAAAAGGVRARLVSLDTFDEAFAAVEKGELDAVVDLRSPLTAVAGFVTAVRDHCGDALDPDARRLLGRSLAASQRMDVMVRDLGAMLRVAGQPLDLQPCDITRLAQSCWMACAPTTTASRTSPSRRDLVAVADHQMIGASPSKT